MVILNKYSSFKSEILIAEMAVIDIILSHYHIVMMTDNFNTSDIPIHDINDNYNLIDDYANFLIELYGKRWHFQYISLFYSKWKFHKRDIHCSRFLQGTKVFCHKRFFTSN